MDQGNLLLGAIPPEEGELMKRARSNALPETKAPMGITRTPHAAPLWTGQLSLLKENPRRATLR